jgi:phage-related protein
MELDSDKKGRRILRAGSCYTIVAAVRKNDNVPFLDFFEELIKKDKRMAAHVFEWFKKVADRPKFHELQCIEREKDSLWAFKFRNAQMWVRIPFYRDQQDLVITHGFLKKTNAWKNSDFRKAKDIYKEDKDRIEGK